MSESLETNVSDRSNAPAAEHPMQLDELFQRLKEHDKDWLSKTLYERWVHVLHEEKELQEYSISGQSPIWPFDVTLPTVPKGLELSDYIHFVRNFDWSATDLGPMSKWTLDLRRMVNMCLCDKRASALWIGPEYVGFYNEGYSVIAGRKHPQFLGRPFAELWTEPGVAERFHEMFSAGLKFGRSSKGDDVHFVLDRHGFREEMWVSFTIVPFADSAGGVFGNYNTVVDTTASRVHQRRLSTMLAISDKSSAAVEIHGFWRSIIEGCGSNASDIPFAAIYSCDSSIAATTAAASKHVAGTSSTTSTDRETEPWKFAGCTGSFEGFDGFPPEVDTQLAVQLFTEAFPHALATGEPLMLSKADKTWPEFLDDAVCSSVQGDSCNALVLLPISPTNREGAVGFLLMGINPLALYDADYKQFVELIARQCATSLASVMLIEEESARARTLAEMAAQDRNELSAQLAETRQEVVENENRFRKMADMAPVAMFQLDQEGNVLYANKNWMELTQHPLDKWGPKSWFQVVHPDDEEIVDKEWSKLLAGHAVSFEMRWKKPFSPEDDEYVSGELVEGATWTLASAYAEKRIDGTVKGILGCLTDISRQKWMEGFQDRRMTELVELKRQQENFMDMTSHEARNPLSAIMLCAESMLTALKELHDEQQDPVSLSRENLAMHLESAEIIMACAQHQKRIIDDVLTLSKLDSGLLMITPVEMQPAKAISGALRMFDGEVHKHDIKLSLEIDKSYDSLSIDWVKQDPSRLLQVLINLLANAIKFTQAEDVRRITVTLNASLNRPDKSLHGVDYINNTWGSPRPAEEEHCVFIGLEVIDTGRGMTPEEMKRLFHKFQQASPKTHVEYGGSGLGLFISRQLARMLGGAMGVASPGRGATFAFYMMAPRCPAPGIAETKPKPLDMTIAETMLDQQPFERRPSANEAAIQLVDPPAALRNHILVVEDNLVNQKVMRNQLERMQYVVTVANHGLEALDHICKTQFYKNDGVPLDFVLMDVEMPVCNGLECARRIRQMQHDGQLRGHVPIIGVTANARAEQQAAARDAGMDTVVTKPFRLLELSSELERMALRFA